MAQQDTIPILDETSRRLSQSTTMQSRITFSRALLWLLCTCAAPLWAGHPDSSKWEPLFRKDLSDAVAPKGIWTWEGDVLTASEDQNIWSFKDYASFVLDLEFKTGQAANSGVIVYCSDIANWIPNSVEIQIADDFAEQWAKSPKTWQCGAIFGHLAASQSVVKKPGEWNRMTVTCKGPLVEVLINEVAVNSIDLRKWTSAKTNPDGSEIPAWLSRPLAELVTKGRIGLQGKHGGAPIFFRNVRIKETAGGTARESTEAPPPFGPLPSERQLQWHEMEFYGFVHFTVNTFTDKEWGYGDEKPAIFNPTDFSADQIALAAREAGMKGLILTAKHHDGFCLWPSKYTEHSVKNSPWRKGKGDVLRELSEACKRHKLKFGVYLSPWDRNHPEYGRPAYLTYYRNQLRELLTQYGPLFTVWFDGANGGDGYYGGARETRKIDNRTFYDWPNTWSIVRELQPFACMFSDAGPDFRWVGNENGIAGDPCWATLDMTKPDRIPGGSSAGLTSGERPGTAWLPAECDVSIRPGWFYHEKEDSKVKTPRQLLDIYYKSVGRGACLNLNLPPDRRGRIHDADLAALKDFKRVLDATFTVDLARSARLTANNVRGNSQQFRAEHLTDGKANTYWATDDSSTHPEVLIDFPKPATFNVVSLREFLPLGQRVEAFVLETWNDGQWQEFAKGTSIGNRRLLRTDTITTARVRLRIAQASACPALSEFALHFEPLNNR